ncbi:MAG: gliding motility-associated C-terminal domain-containing protein, partial [Flavobacteriales bacterium]|nr:gliding motility-associated C-terminal domain-containing protein [Flavobacteriales bacterium]
QNGATDGGSGDSQIISSNLIEISALNDTICAGNSTMLTVSANVTLPSGTSFIWYDAPNNGNFIGAGSAFSTGNLSNDTTFYVGICPGNYTIPVSVIMGASFSSNVNNVIVSDENCGQSDGSITGITINGGVQPLQYEWNTILTSNQDLIGASAGNYTLVVTDGNGCASTIGTFNLGENTGPSIDINNMIINDDHCNQGIGSITGITATGQLPLNIEWNGIMSSSFDLSNIETGTYDLSVTDNFGCTSSINNLIVNNTDGPLIDTSNIQISPETCGSLNGSIANIQVSGISPLSYYWNGNSSNLNLQNIASGLYDLIVEDSFGCSDTILDIYVDAIGYPTANFNFTPDVIYEGDTVYFIDSSFSNISNIVFTLSDGSISNDSITFEVFPERGVYEVCLWVENNFGCADSICQNITVQPNISNINVPNVFTPNGDLNNQYFSILGLDNNYSLSIFNRWGTLLFSESPYLNLWDGTTSSGAELSEGTYYFILEPIENSNGDLQTYSGAVTLIR